MATKEKIEKDVALEAVREADEKVADIKAEKAAKKAKRQEARANWKGPLKAIGKGINWCENNPGPAAVCLVTGTGLGWAGKVVYDHFKSKNAGATEETEVEEAPFDTEA